MAFLGVLEQGLQNQGINLYTMCDKAPLQSTGLPRANQNYNLVSCQMEVSMAAFCDTWVANAFSAHFSVRLLLRKLV